MFYLSCSRFKISIYSSCLISEVNSESTDRSLDFESSYKRETYFCQKNSNSAHSNLACISDLMHNWIKNLHSMPSFFSPQKVSTLKKYIIKHKIFIYTYVLRVIYMMYVVGIKTAVDLCRKNRLRRNKRWIKSTQVCLI